MMKLLLFLIYAFINTFGITQPTPAGARKAAGVLGWMLLAAGVAVAIVVVWARAGG